MRFRIVCSYYRLTTEGSYPQINILFGSLTFLLHAYVWYLAKHFYKIRQTNDKYKFNHFTRHNLVSVAKGSHFNLLLKKKTLEFKAERLEGGKFRG